MRIATLGELDPNVPRPPNWAADKPAILRYLNNGLGVSAARTLLPDELDPLRPRVVNVIIYTDGEWVWSAEQIYYAEHHDIPIDPDLIDHARSRGFEVGEVPDSAVDDALDALQEASADAEPEPAPGPVVDHGRRVRPDLAELTPYQWCEQYAEGLIGREQLIKVLTEYPYTPTDLDREWNDSIVQPRGTFHDVVQASFEDLIDDDLYAAVVDRLGHDRP